MKKWIVILVVILCIGGFLGYVVMKDIPTMKSMSIKHIDISALEDGNYKGEFSYSRWKSNVQVTIKNKEITGIQLLSEKLMPEEATKVFDEIIKDQKNDVDVVTGATATSKAYLKAVENALENN